MDVASINKPFYDEQGFDTFVINMNKNTFGVFDGMGTEEGARAIAIMLANSFNSRGNLFTDCKLIAEHINLLSRTAAASWPHNGSTATVVHIDEDSNLHYAHIGDSRLYVYNEGRIKQVTADEGIGNLLLNNVGAYSHGVNQMGAINILDWDGFMLCTDGITGDWREQLISDQQIESLFKNRQTSEEICRDLISMSKKEDDKTVIVVNQYKGENH